MYSHKLKTYIIHEYDDWHIAFRINLKKSKVDYVGWSIDNLKNSNITDHFNKVFDLNSYYYHENENENEVKENLNQHKNQDSNFFLEALS